MERQVGLPRWRRRDGLLGAACVCVVGCGARLRGEGDDDARGDSGWAVGCGYVRACEGRGREEGRGAKRVSEGEPTRQQAAEAGGIGWAPVSPRRARCSVAARPMFEQRRKGWKRAGAH
ncbi:hypothetical protein GQ55_2G414800 [Panicum hallii var. hallii]|jgi:hypothetical protein|uniref:DUF834 domain-containing protein n=2 Tax=Panicum hallii TaxID=206008 RepID=A0A2T7EXZ6_9POAL|nr:hypothetical protein GQ55_2G414800 [Panicum hallii var. hallii]PVH65121.1 hypothetical protein PAHAL_2G428400 [Panicum hallii]